MLILRRCQPVCPTLLRSPPRHTCNLPICIVTQNLLPLILLTQPWQWRVNQPLIFCLSVRVCVCMSQIENALVSRLLRVSQNHFVTRRTIEGILYGHVQITLEPPWLLTRALWNFVLALTFDAHRLENFSLSPSCLKRTTIDRKIEGALEPLLAPQKSIFRSKILFFSSNFESNDTLTI